MRARFTALLVVLLPLLVGCAAFSGPPREGHDPSPIADAGAIPCPHSAGSRLAGIKPLDLPCLTGPGTVRVSHVHARAEVINVWASWCGPCRKETVRLERAHRRTDPDVLFLGVDVKDSADKARSFLAAQHVTYPQVEDRQGRFARELHLVGVPNTLLVDGSGRIRYRHEGQLHADDVRRLLQRIRQVTNSVG